MCGVFGLCAPRADKEWIARIVSRLFIETEKRGTDSSGMAYFSEEGLKIIKKPMKGSEFAYDEDLLGILRSDSCPHTLIGHCRAKSAGSGSEENNENNHPLFDEEARVALIHNGRVSDHIWKTKDDNGENPFILGEFKADVDTEAILRLLVTLLYIPRGKDGTISPEMVANTPKKDWPMEAQVPVLKAIDDLTFNLSGKNTCGALNEAEPNVLYFWRVENPLFIAFLPKEEAIIFSSTREILEKALTTEEVVYLFGVFEKERKKSAPTFYGHSPIDGEAYRVEWKGVQGKEFDITRLILNPNGADFSERAKASRKVFAEQASDEASVQ